MSHSIDHQQLRKAAELLLTIDDAGYGHQFDRELFETTHGNMDREYRERQSQIAFSLKLAGNNVDTFAKRLSVVLDAPIEQCRGIAMDLLGFAPRREIALDLLKRMAGDVRRLQQQATRQRFAGRRSA